MYTVLISVLKLCVVSFLPQDSSSQTSAAESSGNLMPGESVAQRPGIGLIQPVGGSSGSSGLSSSPVRRSEVPQEGGFRAQLFSSVKD